MAVKGDRGAPGSPGPPGETAALGSNQDVSTIGCTLVLCWYVLIVSWYIHGPACGDLAAKQAY